MADPLNRAEAAVFGDSVRHPVTLMPLERGSGALPIKQQARQHLFEIARTRGRAAADEVCKRLDEFEANGGTVAMPPPDTNRIEDRARPQQKLPEVPRVLPDVARRGFDEYLPSGKPN
jgi:hypothetical protein